MRDATVSNPRLQKLHPKVRATFRSFIEDVEAHDSETCLRIMQGLRTFAEQDALAAQVPKVTNAKGGQSLHNYGLAIDLCEMDGARNEIVDWKFDMATLQAIATKHGIEWGGSWRTFKDYPHFQITFGKTWQQLKALHDAGKVDKDGYVLL